MRVLLIGAGVSAALGMMLGGAMHPTNLLGDDRPLGPQMLLGGGVARAERLGGDPAVTLASYRGKLPDYVLGTDTTRPKILADEPPAAAADESPILIVEPDAPPPAVYTRAAYDEPPPPSRYPSMDGGEVHHAVSADDRAVDAAYDAPGAGG